jgi:hypothetical protein
MHTSAEGLQGGAGRCSETAGVLATDLPVAKQGRQGVRLFPGSGPISLQVATASHRRAPAGSRCVGSSATLLSSSSMPVASFAAALPLPRALLRRAPTPSSSSSLLCREMACAEGNMKERRMERITNTERLKVSKGGRCPKLRQLQEMQHASEGLCAGQPQSGSSGRG